MKPGLGRSLQSIGTMGRWDPRQAARLVVACSWVVVLLGVSGCTVLRWQAVQANADPAPAYILIKETGETYGPVPATIYVRERFWLLEPRERTYTFVFRKAGAGTDSIVVKLRDWKQDIEDAKSDPYPIYVLGILHSDP